MILLVDADSLIFASCYSNDKQGQFYTDIEDAINKFDQQFMKIVNDLEEKFEKLESLRISNSYIYFTNENLEFTGKFAKSCLLGHEVFGRGAIRGFKFPTKQFWIF